ncbi:amino acid transporter AVT1E [Selaginella moellendorffii]|uniref:amino acid transporter AVT1E n=1 Tax=Selaginella moellendorffii TaxID=88036 RepID=UPI000D1CD18C|nr:amino acid transporter AVT1E [Selaginella moellendorffii]|eukprot:XP_024517461.1 amino acid transporter AVT1E [Selaginella moellendorffii]
MVTSGYVGVGICIGIGLFYWCGVLLMIGCMQYSGDISRYTLIASTAFPRWGRLITSLLFYLETLCTLLGFLIAVGDLAQSIPTHLHHFGLLNTREFATFVAMGVIVPATWFEKLSTVSFFSLCCTLGLLFVMALTIYIGFFDGVGFKARIPLVRTSQISKSIGIYSFGYGSAPIYPSIYYSMRNQGSFTLVRYFVNQYSWKCCTSFQVLSIAFGVFTAVFLLFGLLGSFMFGLAIWVSFVIPVSKFPLLMHPITSDVHEIIARKFSIQPKSLVSIVIRVVVSSFTTLVIMAIALGLPKFADDQAYIPRGGCRRQYVRRNVTGIDRKELLEAYRDRPSDWEEAAGIVRRGLASEQEIYWNEWRENWPVFSYGGSQQDHSISECASPHVGFRARNLEASR